MEDEEKDVTVLLRWILGTCLGTCGMDLTDLGHCFVEIIVIFDSITPQEDYQSLGRREFNCIQQNKHVCFSHL